MTKDEALRLALEALELAHPRFNIATEKHKQAITAIKAALEAKNEPEYYGLTKDHLWMSISKEHYDRLKPEFRMTCYTTPPQRKPLVFGLNDDGQFTFSVGVQTFTLDYFPENDEETEFMKRQLTHAIEAAHGIKGEA